MLPFLLYMFRGEIRWARGWVRDRLAARTVRLPPPPAGRILDAAGVLDPGARSALADLARTIEARTGAEVDVVTVPTLQGMTVEHFANRLFNTWKLGKAGRNNGVLLLIAPAEHRVRIEVGYGLEAELPDGMCGDIIRNALVPAFKVGRFGPGAVEAVTRIGRIIGGLPRDEAPFFGTPAARDGATRLLDGAHLLSPRTRELTANELGLIRERFGIEVYVMTVPSRGGRPVQDVAQERFLSLPLDPARRARAMLLLVTAHEHAARFVLGDGLGRAVSPEQADRLARTMEAELAKGNVLGAFWSAAADLDHLLAGRMTMLGIPRTPDQADRARDDLRRAGGLGLALTTLFLCIFVAIGGILAGAGWASRTVFLVIFGTIFAAVPLIGFGLEPVSLGMWWPVIVMGSVTLICARVGWEIGGNHMAYWTEGGTGAAGSGRSGRSSDAGWTWGGSGGSGGFGGSGGGGGGGGSGGGGASGSW